MKKIIFGLIALCSAIAIAFANTFEVEHKYRAAYTATCGVVTSNTLDFGNSGGTGVMLSSGYILTCFHVIDTNQNGKLDIGERNVNIKFYYPEASIHSGTVISTSRRHWAIDTEYAVIDIKDKGMVKSNINPISDEDYEKVWVGAKLFSVGRTDGSSPPHISVGLRSTDTEAIWHRTTMPLYFGNSGGGVFLEETGELIGLCTRLRVKKDMFGNIIPIPSWSEYTPITHIRRKMIENNADFFIKPRRYY